MVRLSGLWKRTNTEGKVSFTGNIGTAKIVILSNERKEVGSNSPDFILYVDNQQQKSEWSED